ncbi:hypothetical protein [Gynuella sunshinyii]|uniref:Uncharacterized protein n=1 Tax=Gynuella sunshinyii YC6258 TaxID=1445510 RepID=A0A0C5VFY4_9GAMM|nr:hypothetical protein [Gynuella sunshinyii]AJQ92283.1 hypothetical Protein YC6258_00231 [Gynuella sunshinyii YC6258]
MEVNQAIDIVVHHLQEESGLLLKIGLNEGIDQKAFDELIEAMKFLADDFQNVNEIPKRLSACFIDLTPYFMRSIDWYSEADKEKIEDIRDAVVSMANDICS